MPNPLLDISGLPRFDLIKPQHAVPAIKALIAAHRQKLSSLLNDKNARDFETLVVPLEEMQHELERVWAPISHLQSVLDDPAWRDAYNASLPLMTEYGTELSQNKDLQEAYQAVADSLPQDATAAMRRLLEQALRDFRLAGVSLPDVEKARFREISQELATLKARFDQNVQDATDDWHLHTTEPTDVSGIPETTLQRARDDAEASGVEGWWFKLDFPNYHAIMTHCDARHVRESFYTAWSTRASDLGDERWDNSDIIARILALRHEMAGLVGFDNFAEYSLATKMAGTVDEVLSFLEALAERSKPAAIREFNEIQALAEVPLEAWDVSYYLEKFKQQEFAISDQELRQYFPFATVKQGLFHLAEKLYGVSVVANSVASAAAPGLANVSSASTLPVTRQLLSVTWSAISRHPITTTYRC